MTGVTIAIADKAEFKEVQKDKYCHPILIKRSIYRNIKTVNIHI